MRSTEGFLASQEDPRVFYEPGAENSAHVISSALPSSIERVEEAQYGVFVIPVKVYICATVKSYARFTGQEKSGGDTTVAKKIFISPKPENTSQRLPFVLTHELSHLHLGQRLNLYQFTGRPTWFTEGLAVFVSGGGGAESVSEAEAARSILAGQHLDPNDSHTVFSHDTASHFDLQPHMFYRQAAMFIAYLKEKNPDGFRLFISDVEKGKLFKTAVEDSFRTDLNSIWHGFVNSLSKDQKK